MIVSVSHLLKKQGTASRLAEEGDGCVAVDGLDAGEDDVGTGGACGRMMLLEIALARNCQTFA